MDEEAPRCILGRKELGGTETEELRERERSSVFIRTMMDGAHQRLCGDDDADVSQLFALSIAEHSRSVSLGSEPMLQKTRKPLKIEL